MIGKPFLFHLATFFMINELFIAVSKPVDGFILTSLLFQMRFFIIFLTFFSSLVASTSLHLSCYKDDNRTLTINDVIYNDQIDFKPITSINYGFSESIFWIRVEVHNSTMDPYVLEFNDVRIDYADVYNQEGLLLYQLGDMRTFSNHLYNDPHVAFVIAPSNTPSVHYIQLHTENKINLSATLFNADDYANLVEKRDYLKSLYFGVLGGLFLFNFFIMLLVRERPFVDYLLYHIGLIIAMLYYNGVIGQLVAPNIAGLGFATVPLSIAAYCTFMSAQFMRSYLNTSKENPVIDKVLLSFMGLNFLIILLDFSSVSYPFTHTLFGVTMIIESTFLLVSAFYIYYIRRNPLALFYFLGWIMMMVGIIITALVMMNFLPRSETTAAMFQVGSIFEVILFSLGLAYRFKLVQVQLNEKSRLLQEQSKLAAMGDMVRAISHQWRQPLNEINSVVMRIDTDFHDNLLDGKKLNHALGKIEQITEHLSETITTFNRYYQTTQEPVNTSFEHIIEKCLLMFEGSFKKYQIISEVRIVNTTSFKVDEGLMIQVVSVILNNAVDVLNQRQISNRKIMFTIKKEHEYVVLLIEDNGGGITVDPIEKIFEPYYSTKFDSDSVGIGLYMATTLLKSVGAHLEVSNTQTGAEFKIRL